MRDRWEKMFADYTNIELDVAKIANRGSHLIQLVSKLTTVAILYFGAKAMIAGDPALSRSNPRRSMIGITEYEAGLD